MVISTNDLFSMMIIRVCAVADIPKGSEKAETPAVAALRGCLPAIAGGAGWRDATSLTLLA